MMHCDTILSRLDPSPKKDAGHYVDLPVPRCADTLEVAEGEDITLIYKLGLGDGMMERLPFSNIVVGANARLNLVAVVLPGIDAELPVSVDIVGPGAEVNVSGLYICKGAEKVSIRTDVRHRVPGCISRQLFNGVAGGSSRVDFYGKITVAPDAQKTEAYQTNHNLVVSDNARVETKPQLEIYADDVKCSHGATVGQLNEDEQFYMRSRGIPEDEARILQIISFIAPVLAAIPDEQARESLSAEVEAAVRG